MARGLTIRHFSRQRIAPGPGVGASHPPWGAGRVRSGPLARGGVDGDRIYEMDYTYNNGGSLEGFFMHRDPPSSVKKILRKEVGFGCPVTDCGCPYLEWHHFDPAWHVRNHHEPKGMIALCREHHIQADHGAFTTEQLRHFKKCGRSSSKTIEGKFNWMRNRLLLAVGGNFYYETLGVFKFQGREIIWLERSTDGYLTVNINMLTTSGLPRARMINNQWYGTNLEDDIECPPSAKRIKVRYSNGDHFSLEFTEANSESDILKSFPEASVGRWDIPFPITLAAISYSVGGTNISFGSRGTTIEGLSIVGVFMKNCGWGIVVN